MVLSWVVYGALLLPVVIVFSVYFVLHARSSVTFRGMYYHYVFSIYFWAHPCNCWRVCWVQRAIYLPCLCRPFHLGAVRRWPPCSSTDLQLFTADELCLVVVTLPKCWSLRSLTRLPNTNCYVIEGRAAAGSLMRIEPQLMRYWNCHSQLATQENPPSRLHLYLPSVVTGQPRASG